MKKKPTIYRISYINQNQVYELNAKSISTETLIGFISISDIIFDLKEAVVIDPVEEQIKAEFSDVEVLHVPFSHVLKIEEVKRKRSCKISPLKSMDNNNPMKTKTGPQK